MKEKSVKVLRGTTDEMLVELVISVAPSVSGSSHVGGSL